MCYFAKAPKFRKITKHYDLVLPEGWENGPYDEYGDFENSELEVNGFEHPYMPIIIDNNPKHLELGQWGLIPKWAKSEKIEYNTLNAQIEDIHEKRSYKDYVENRCLIITEEFYDWKHQEPGKAKSVKDKYAINVKGQEIFCLAGIYSFWNDRLTFTIVTTKANALMSDIHNTKMRMPVVLKKENEWDWLQGKPIEKFAYPYEAPLQAKRLTYNIPNELF